MSQATPLDRSAAPAALGIADGARLLLRARPAPAMGEAGGSGGPSPARWREGADAFNAGSPRARRALPGVRPHKSVHAGPARPESL